MTPRLTRLWRGIVALLRRRRVEDDLDRELRSFEQIATDTKGPRNNNSYK